MRDNDIHTACGRYPALPDDIHACGVDDICEPGLANDEAPKPFRFRGFIYPGSYLLSRDLSSDYHRRADVSLPGSEWDRVGPSGYDHQASACFVLLFRLPDYHLRLRVAFYFSAAGWHPRGLFCVLL